jgi:ABC-2 type transport system permease protein
MTMMWTGTVGLAARDLRILLRRPITLMWAFLMPPLFFSFIGRVTSGFATTMPENDPIAVFAPADSGFLLPALERRLGEVKYEPRRVESEQELNRFGKRLTIPPGLTEKVLRGEPVKLVFENKGEGAGAAYDTLRIRKAVYGLLAEVVATGRLEGTITEAGLRKTGALPRQLQIEVVAAGRRKEIPNGYQQSVPGSLVMFTLMVMLTSGGISLVIERKQGILRRLASSPMSRPAVVASKLGSRFALGLLQLVVGIIVASFMYRIDWGSAPLALGALLVAYVALCASLGVWLGSIARSEGQAAALGTIGGNVLAALGGCWWPAEITPAWMQKMALALPTGITMNGLHQLMSFGADGSAVLPQIAALAAGTVLFGWLAARSFRFQ